MEQEMKYLGYKASKRKDGRYCTRILVGTKHVYVYGNNLEEWKNKLKIAVNKKNNQNSILNDEIYLFDWIDTWFETEKVPKLKETSLETMRLIIKNHIKTNIENMIVSKIRPIDIDVALNKIKSSRIRLYAYQIYRGVFLYAYKNSLTEKNLRDLISPVTHTKQKGKGLTREQQKILIKKSNELERPWIWHFYLFSGVRRNEALSLKWNDIKFDSIVIRGTKTTNALRVIPLFDKLKDVLNKIPHTSEFVFDMSLATLKRDTRRLEQLCGFEFAIKDLRHTFASNCFELGIKDKVLQSWMGHANINTTKDYYIHTSKELEEEQIKIINQFLI